jgi:hypothetical protein
MSKRTIAPMEIDGTTIWVEVEQVEIETAKEQEGYHPPDLRPGAEPTGAKEWAAEQAASIADTVKACVRQVQQGLAEMKPDEWSVECSIEFAGKGKIPYIASGEVNGGLKLTMKWKREGNN